MLNHTVGGIIETRAPLAQSSIEQYRKTLHPRFAHLGDMLYYMGRYVLIDPKAWGDYKKDHANYFMECLLLGEMLRNEELGNLPLHTTQPRPATDPMAPARRDAVAVESRSSHNYAASLTQYNAVPYSVSNSGSKRKPDTDAQGSPVPKRHCTGPAQLRRSSCRSSNQDHAALAGTQPEIAQPERNPFLDRVNQGEFLDPDVVQTNYVASQETPETKKQLEQEALTQSPEVHRSLQAFDAANDIQMSMLCGERWFTVSTE